RDRTVTGVQTCALPILPITIEGTPPRSLATLLAVPIGLLAAIYLSEYRDGLLAPIVRFVGELLGGVPSIVIGIFAYTLIIRSSRSEERRVGKEGYAEVV